MLRRNSFLMSVCLVVFMYVSGIEASELVTHGRASSVIVIGDNPTKAQRFAAEEVQVFLEKMTGVRVAIEETDRIPETAAVIIGRHPANGKITRKLKEKYPIRAGSWATAGNYDAFAIACDAKQLHLAGNSEDALLYAVWDWLESLGVRWILPTEKGTYVPSLTTVVLQPMEKIEGPAMAYRGPGYPMRKGRGFPASAQNLEHGLTVGTLFTLRQRLNHNVSFDPADAWVMIGSGHSYFHYLPPERYFKAHPEWYSMQNGKRCGNGEWQLCFTNDEAAEEFSRNIMAAVAKEVKQGTPIEHLLICVSPNDDKACCECGACRKLVDTEGSATSLVTNFANLVATKIRKVYPTGRIVFYAYDNYARPGDYVKPGPGVCAELTAWSANTAVGANHAQPMMSQANFKFLTYFNQWASLCDQVAVHEYYGHYSWFTPWPMLTQMANDIPLWAKNSKCFGMYSESHLHWGTQAPNFYLQSKLMWNPEIDVAAVMKDYYARGFGPAGPAIRRYYQILQRQMDRLSYICGYLTEITQLLTPEILARCNECINQAQKAMPGMDDATKWRTQLIIDGWRYSVKTAQAIQLYIRPQPRPGDREKIITLLGDVMSFMDTEQGQWVFENKIAKPEVNKIYRSLALPLDQLPKGEQTLRLKMGYGGAVKFWSHVQGFSPNIWGYNLGPKRQGVLELPLRAAQGCKIASVTFSLGIVRNPQIKVAVVVVDGRKREKVLTDNVSEPSDKLIVPADVLGGSTLKLKVTAVNQTNSEQVVLTNVDIAVTVN